MMRLSGHSISNLGTKTAQSLKNANERISKKISGTFIERTINYFKNVYIDYKQVAVELRSDIKAKPVKAACFFTGFGVLMYSMTHNPDERSFRAKFIQCANDVSLVSLSLVNPSAAEHLKFVQTCYNKDLIRHTTFGLFSIIWVDKFSDQCDMYETNCSYLKVPYRKITDHIIDVGFLNIWWIISRKMLDYDINY